MSTDTPSDLSRLAREAVELAEKATPGPWHLAPPRMGFGSVHGSDGGLVFGLAAGMESERTHDADDDARLLAHMCANYATLARALLDLLAARQGAAWVEVREKAAAFDALEKIAAEDAHGDMVLTVIGTHAEIGWFEEGLGPPVRHRGLRLIDAIHDASPARQQP